MASIFRRIMEMIILLCLAYLTWFYMQVSPILALLHIVLLLTYTAFMIIDMSGRHVVSRTFYILYTTCIVISVACCIFLVYVNILLTFTAYPLYPAALACFYSSILVLLASSIFKLRYGETGKRRRRYWRFED